MMIMIIVIIILYYFIIITVTIIRPCNIYELFRVIYSLYESK